MAQQIVKPKTNLGPGFWWVTLFIVVISIIMTILVYRSPLPIGLVQAGDPAASVDSLFKFLGAVASWIFNAVVIYTVYFGIVFARPKNAPASTIGVQIHDAPALEFWWTAIPTILVVVLSIFSVKIWSDLQNTAGDVLTVEAIGYQFGFQFRYPNLSQPVAELHLPVNTPVTIHTTSRDVIHGFWLPEFRQKVDMVPGLINTLRIVPRETGTFRIICSEFCGVAHGGMRSTITIDSPAAFKKWFAAQQAAQGGSGSALTPGGASTGGSANGGGAGGTSGGGVVQVAGGSASAGQATFQSKCTACHSTGTFSQKIVGPGLGHIFSDPSHPKLVDGAVPTPENVATIIHNGYTGDIGTMPSAQMNGLSNADIANLVAYLQSLSKK